MRLLIDSLEYLNINKKVNKKLNIIVDKTININKGQNTKFNKKSNTKTDKAINISKKHNTIANKAMNANKGPK